MGFIKILFHRTVATVCLRQCLLCQFSLHGKLFIKQVEDFLYSFYFSRWHLLISLFSLTLRTFLAQIDHQIQNMVVLPNSFLLPYVSKSSFYETSYDKTNILYSVLSVLVRTQLEKRNW